MPNTQKTPVTHENGWKETRGRCVECGSADYTQVCYRGKPRYGPNGLYCEPCFREADTNPFGENPFD